MSKTVFDIIRKPITTEKGTLLTEKENKYLFKVDKKATKPQIKRAIEKIFNVKVKDVNVAIVRGKNKRIGKFMGKQQNWKKAIISLAEGHKINIFEGV